MKATGAAAAAAADAGEEDLSQFYGFMPLEAFKLNRRSSNLIAADLNHDQKTDLILIDNSNNRLDLLQQRAAPPEKAVRAPNSTKTNQIENDWRFEHRKIAVDRAVSALAVGDLNHDGRQDLVYLASGDQLIVRRQTVAGEWTVMQRLRLPDTLSTPWSIAAGDLNSDQRHDVVVLGKNATYVLLQDQEGGLEAPQKLMNTTESISLVQIADLDGDGRNDLSYLILDDAERPFGARLQGTDGRLGPEIRCELPKPRGVTLANIDGQPGAEILAIEAQTGRVKAHQLQRPHSEPGELAGQLIQYGFGASASGRGRDLALGDINGDGLTDAVITDPEAAQMIVMLQRAQLGLDLGTMYPGLLGAEHVRIGDLDGNGQNEVIVLSSREKTIGLSRFLEGRLSFPQTVTVESTEKPDVKPETKEAIEKFEPLLLELADLNADKNPDLVVLSFDRNKLTGHLAALSLSKDGKWSPTPLGAKTATLGIPFKATPDRLQTLDANHDGQPDFLIFFPAERAPVLVLSGPNGSYAAKSSDSGLGMGKVSAGQLFLGQLSAGEMAAPVVLVSQNNFARNLKLSDAGSWDVVDQYNATEADAKIAGSATLDLDGEPGNEIVLVDTGAKKLRVLHREKNVYRPWKELDLGAFAFKSIHVADMNGDRRPDLLLVGPGKLGILYAGQSDARLKTIANYETTLEDVHFTDLAVGDLNGDDLPDVAVVDTRSQYIDILDFVPGTGLRHALHFKVFEAKSFSDEEEGGSEPREIVISDVTGDGRADLILLSHDRVLLYPQDSGR